MYTYSTLVFTHWSRLCNTDCCKLFANCCCMSVCMVQKAADLFVAGTLAK